MLCAQFICCECEQPFASSDEGQFHGTFSIKPAVGSDYLDYRCCFPRWRVWLSAASKLFQHWSILRLNLTFLIWRLFQAMLRRKWYNVGRKFAFWSKFWRVNASPVTCVRFWAMLMASERDRDRRHSVIVGNRAAASVAWRVDSTPRRLVSRILMKPEVKCSCSPQSHRWWIATETERRQATSTLKNYSVTCTNTSDSCESLKIHNEYIICSGCLNCEWCSGVTYRPGRTTQGFI